MTIASPDSHKNEDKVSITNPTYAKHEYADSGEIEPEVLHHGDSNLSIDSMVPEAKSDNKDSNIGGGVVEGALAGYYGDDEDHVPY